MRKYILRGRVYAGEHIIYDNEEEYYKHNPTKKLIHWLDVTPENTEAGDWVIAEDGFICQLLKKSVLKNKAKQITYLFRFPMVTCPVFMLKSGKLYRRCFYGMYTPFHKNNTSGNAVLSAQYRYNDILLYMVRHLIKNGIHPLVASKLVLGEKNKKRYISVLKDVMEDTTTKVLIMESLDSFRKKINEQFTDERMISELEELLVRSRKGTVSHRQNLEFILQLKNILVSKTMVYADTKMLTAEDTTYEQLPPPG